MKWPLQEDVETGDKVFEDALKDNGEAGDDEAEGGDGNANRDVSDGEDA